MEGDQASDVVVISRVSLHLEVVLPFHLCGDW